MRESELARAIITPQQSDLWLSARIGRITGSRLGDLMAAPTTRASTRKGVSCPAGSEAASRADYRSELIVERLYRKAKDHFVTQAMQDGVEREPYARMLYEADTSELVEQVGFALHPLWDWFGVSADGLCGDDGGVELKCPTNTVHDSYALNPQTLADEYKWQCLGCLICFPERQWWDLCSFNPYAPNSIKLVKFRFDRADWAETIASIESEAVKMHEEVEAVLSSRGFDATVFEIMPKHLEGKRKQREALSDEGMGITDSDLPQWFQEMKAG